MSMGAPGWLQWLKAPRHPHPHLPTRYYHSPTPLTLTLVQAKSYDLIFIHSSNSEVRKGTVLVYPGGLVLGYGEGRVRWMGLRGCGID